MIDKIFLIHHSHMDIGFTDFASAVRKKHLEYIDEAVKYCQRSSDNPNGLRLKWTVKSSWVIEDYINNRNTEQIKSLIDLIHKGQIEVTGLYTQLLTDLASHEEIIRSVYFAEYLRKRYNIRIDSAMINDIGGYTWCLPQVLAKSGIRYLCAGPGGFGVLIPLSKLPRLFYWKSQDRNKILFWQIGFDRNISLDNVKVYEDFPAQYGFGNDYFTHPFSESPEKGKEKLKSLLERMNKEEYPYDAIMLQSGADNRGIMPDLVKIVADWNDKIGIPEVRLSTLHEFFNYMEEKYGDRIPEFSGEISDPWSDRANTKARETGVYRSCQNDIVSLEKLSSILSILNNGYKYPKESIDKIYKNILLYTDHTYGLNMWGWQEMWRKAGSIKDSVFDKYRKSWEDKSRYTKDAKEGIDRLLEEAVSYAKGIPSFGVKTFNIHEKNEDYGRIDVGHNSIENDFYRVDVDEKTGNIRSIYDKELRVELTDSNSPHFINQFIFSEVRGIPEKFIRAGIPKDVSFVYHYVTPVSVEKGRDEGLVKSLIVKSDGVNFPIEIRVEQEIVLYSYIKRIDFVNRIIKEENPDKEAVYFAFPFNVPGGVFHCELPNAIMRIGEDQLDGSHTDFQAVQHWVDISNKDFGITWVPHEAPLVEFGGIRTHKWAGLSYKPQHRWIYAYVMNNHPNTDTPPWQGGESIFTFSMTSHKGGYKAGPAVRFGWDCTNSMVANIGRDFKIFSFCKIEPENIFLLTFKQAEDRDGYILRFWEVEGRDTAGTVSFPQVRPKKAYITNLVENNIEEAKIINDEIRLSLKGFELATVRISFK